MSDVHPTSENELNPLLFLSEQLIHLEGSKAFGSVSVAHVSDDDGPPTPTTAPSGPMADDTKTQQRTQIINHYLADELDPTSSSTLDEEEDPFEDAHSTTRTDSICNTTTPRSNSSDIGSMVHKAKRAAASLWMVLHAQECRFGGDKCPFQGCLDTKTLLLHVKNCPSKSDHSPCPEQMQGCTEARKLLTHYRRCREIRALKRTSYHSSSHASQHSCLICSLLARHARNVLESTAAASTLASIGFTTTSCPLSSVSMPPPPPRPRTCSLGSMPHHHQQQQQPTLLGSTALAQIVPLPQHSFSLSSSTTNFLGKHNGQVRSSLYPTQSTSSYGRPRATSLDEHNSVFSTSKLKGGPQRWTHSSPSSSSSSFHPNEKDPTLEFGILDSMRRVPSLSSIEEVESMHRLE